MKSITLKALVIFFSLSLFACAGMQQEPVWIDVRTVDEYSANHIEGDENIPLATIDAEALAAKYGKDAEINLYCRSGNRAGQAKDILEAAGFTHVNNMGGIDDVSKLRAVAVSSSAQ